jgi:REP element-mobilizing transposase RayT
MKNYYPPLLSEGTYHIYNRANNQDILFYNAQSYKTFLEKLAFYLGDYLDLYAYCLMPNHFHLLARIKTAEEITVSFQKDLLAKGTSSKRFLAWLNGEAELSIDEMITERFRSFFISYAKSFSLYTKRRGALFMRPFKRLLVDSDVYFSRLVYYIHANPAHHKVMIDFQHYEWSSYKRHLVDKPTLLRKEMVLDWFGGKTKYEGFHQEGTDFKDIERYIIEDDD